MSTPTAHAQPSLFKRLVFFAVLAIALMGLVASSVAATSAQFSDTAEGNVNVSTGEVVLNLEEPASKQFEIHDLMPGVAQSEDLRLTNDSTTNIDIYGWLEPGGGGFNFCTGPGSDDGELQVRVPGWGKGWVDFCELIWDDENDWDGEHVGVQLGDNVTNQISRTIEVRLTEDTGNEWQNRSNWGTTAVFYAVPAGTTPDFPWDD